ncbi:hypothetical protein DDZ18_07915 [Marinicauda salina]|uniref:DUF2459 domain-containing protein n=1 Tax=Marinicauda salina TaxID=2135793 RepID=A0A2U2BV35_9PROT|nr:DUF2459 domain-containing protein [Marinicauda salina]PWE17862.1 hypothetical protein DDZ18_07915 [Marinicauda salina]
MRVSAIARRPGLLALVGVMILAACAGSADRPPPPGPGDCAMIAVSAGGWHTEIHLPARAVAPASPLRRLYPDAAWYAVGWGDAEAFRRGITPVSAVTALAWPTPSVLHVAAFDRPPDEALNREFVDVAVSEAGLARLAAEIDAAFALDEAGAPRPAGAGWYGPDSGFVHAAPRYHLFHTCNVWTAARLSEAGAPAGAPGTHLLPRSLMRRLSARAAGDCAAFEADAVSP